MVRIRFANIMPTVSFCVASSSIVRPRTLVNVNCVMTMRIPVAMTRTLPENRKAQSNDNHQECDDPFYLYHAIPFTRLRSGGLRTKGTAHLSSNLNEGVAANLFIRPICSPVCSLLYFDLTRFICFNFRNTPVALDQSRDAHILVSVFRFEIAEFFLVTAPNHDCEYLVRISLVEIQESRLAASATREVAIDYFSAYGRFFSNMILGFRCGQMTRLAEDSRRNSQQKEGYCTNSEIPHKHKPPRAALFCSVEGFRAFGLRRGYALKPYLVNYGG